MALTTASTTVSTIVLTTDHFKDLVKTETKILNNLCQQWTDIMDKETDIPEEGFGQIRSTIGKSHLLINQRFKQFSGLVDDCEQKRGPKETKIEDLQGFWDMVYYQVLDLHQGFEALNKLKDNKWCEPEPQPKEVKPVLIKKVRSATVLPKVDKNRASVKSKIREQIQNLKNKKSEQTEVKNESFGEKENKKIENIVESDLKWDQISKTNELKVKINDEFNKFCQSVPAIKAVKRTPLLKK